MDTNLLKLQANMIITFAQNFIFFKQALVSTGTLAVAAVDCGFPVAVGSVGVEIQASTTRVFKLKMLVG